MRGLTKYGTQRLGLIHGKAWLAESWIWFKLLDKLIFDGNSSDRFATPSLLIMQSTYDSLQHIS